MKTLSPRSLPPGSSSIPVATYRLQLNADFDFDRASALCPYLSDLGVTHLYTSPCLQAAAGSTHGYDVVDPRRVSRELGGEEGLSRFTEGRVAHGLGHVLDIVPNHMAITGSENPWWWDVLENGPSSRYAGYFDVDWDAPEPRSQATVFLPVLGDHYGRVLERGELGLEREGCDFRIRYHDRMFPVAPRSLDAILGPAARRSGSEKMAFFADALSGLPFGVSDRATVERRHRDKELIRGLLGKLLEEEPGAAAALDQTLEEINSDPDALDALLDRQNYRLAFWKASRQNLGYRRFFNINSLVGLRVEDPAVFADAHARVLGWVRAGLVDGLRVDHIDGLLDPVAYLRRLRHDCPRTWIVVEKILEPGEPLREAWPVDGTTGYDFLNRVNGLFVDAESEGPLTELYVELTGQPADYGAVVRASKRQVLRELLASDVNRLTDLLVEVCESHRRYRDYTRDELRQALVEVIVQYPVYRTYVRSQDEEASPEDGRMIDCALTLALRARPDLDRHLFVFLRRLMKRRIRGPKETELVLRLQQLTGPAMAKGVEDTTFYRYNRLVSLNEVGGDPGRFGSSVEEFHRFCSQTQRDWPATMLATSTHDTKRSEDVRARLDLLSEIPDCWGDRVRSWMARNARYRTGSEPDANAEYLLYQTLAGAWPIEEQRLQAFMEKAAREARVHTTWAAPNPDYEGALRRFVASVMSDEEFITEVGAFVDILARPARVNSLAQTLLKLTAPGVPDLYQGTELWDFSLVDPDNRRPVDYELRRRLLAELDRLSLGDIQARAEGGLPKLWLIRQTLALRRQRPAWFGPDSDYVPLAPAGRRLGHVVGFMRGGAVTIVPRLMMRVPEWEDTRVELPTGPWTNTLTGEAVAGGEVRLDRLLARFPVALLAREDAV